MYIEGDVSACLSFYIVKYICSKEINTHTHKDAIKLNFIFTYGNFTICRSCWHLINRSYMIDIPFIWFHLFAFYSLSVCIVFNFCCDTQCIYKKYYVIHFFLSFTFSDHTKTYLRSRLECADFSMLSPDGDWPVSLTFELVAYFKDRQHRHEPIAVAVTCYHVVSVKLWQLASSSLWVRAIQNKPK